MCVYVRTYTSVGKCECECAPEGELGIGLGVCLSEFKKLPKSLASLQSQKSLRRHPFRTAKKLRGMTRKKKAAVRVPHKIKKFGD